MTSCCYRLYFMIFRKRQKHVDNTQAYTEPAYLLDAQMPELKMDYAGMVNVPDGIGEHEWIAMHSKKFFFAFYDGDYFCKTTTSSNILN